MLSKKLFIFIALIYTSLFSNENVEKKEDIIIKNGDYISNSLTNILSQKLKQKIKKVGYKKAIEFCSTNALYLTKDLEKKITKKLGHNVIIRRVSLKYRNKNNKPTQKEINILNIFKKDRWFSLANMAHIEKEEKFYIQNSVKLL